MKKKGLQTVWLMLVVAFLYLPILILAVYSFTKSTMIGSIRGFSVHNYVTLFTTKELTDMIELVNQIPVVNSDVVTGFSICVLLIVFAGIDKDTYIPLIVGQTVLCTPFVYLSVLPKLKQMDPDMYMAALDLGCTPAKALRTVIFRELVPGIAAGFMTAVTLSLDDYFITTYTKPATFNTISTYVVNATRGARTEIKTALWALSTVIFLLVVLFVVVINSKDLNKSTNVE